jgi:hypothetical protein
MPLPPMTPRRWLAACLAGAFVLGMVALRWDSRTGFTALLSFGGPKWEERLPVLQALPIAKDTGTGYDGQFGAQLAVAPDPRLLEVQRALDNPSYRSRRILLPWTAHFLGRGNAWATLQVFALQNVVLWLVVAWLTTRALRVSSDPRAVALWLACVLTLGALDSVRLSLTDLGAVALLLGAAELLGRGRPWAAAGALALAGLARETSVLATTLLWPRTKQDAPKALARVILAILPLALWVGWLYRVLPQAGALGNDNFNWPGVSFVQHCFLCIGRIAGGDFDSRYTMGLLGALSLAYQSLSLLLRPRPASVWWRMGVPFAVLCWFVGDPVWSGYWAASRALLPMTFAYNLLLQDEEKQFWGKLTLANLPLVAHGVWRMLP